MARVFLELLGDATSAMRALVGTKDEALLLEEATTSSNTVMMGSNDKMALNVEKTTKVWAEATAKRIEMMRLQAAEARKLAAVVGESSAQGMLLTQRATQREASIARLTGVPVVAGAGGSVAATDAAALERRRIDERNASQFLRGGAKGLGGLGGLGFAALAGTSFIGAYAGAAALRSVVAAAQEAQASEKLLENATKNVGASFKAWKPYIDGNVQSLSEMSGFTNEQINQGLVQLVRSTGNVREALRLSGLAADIARGRNIDYNTSALLISKVVNGNVGLFKRYGVAVQSGATVQEALAAAQKKFAGAAEAYGKTSAGAFDRFHASVHRAEVTIGQALLPDLTKLATHTANWLNKAEKTGKLTADLHAIGRAVHPLIGAFEQLAGAIGDAKNAWDQFSKVKLPSWMDPHGRGSSIFHGVISTILKDVFVPGYGLKLLLGGARGDVFGAGGKNSDVAAAARAAIAFERNPWGKGLYPGSGSSGATIDKFALTNLPQHLQNQIARAVSPAQKRAADQAEIAAINDLLNTKGALSPAARTQALKDRARAEAQIAQIEKAQAAHATATARSAAAAVSKDPLLAQAKLALAQGETQVADRLLRTDKARLEEELKQAKTAEMRLAITKQLTQVVKELHAKDAGFVESKKLQLAQAKADAQAVLAGGTTEAQLRVARELKAAAMKAINSHRLTMQGLIDAWNAVSQANSVLASAMGMVNTYHAVSSKALTQGLHLSAEQRQQLRLRYAQAEAHRGYAPSHPVADGQIIDVHIHSDIDQTITKIDRRKRHTHQRAGGRR